MIDWNDYKNFTRAEFECACCGVADMDADFMERLQQLRERVAFPFQITSGYRCPVYNARVSRTGATGPHTTGKAADIAVADGGQSYAILADFSRYGFTGLGVANTFIHLDTLERGENGAWRPVKWGYS